MDGAVAYIPKSIFSSRHRTPRETRKHRQIREMLEQKESDSNHLAFVKNHPSFEPSVSETRPLPKCCQKCVPGAEALIQSEMKFSGLVDCLIPSITRFPSSLIGRKMFPIYTYYSWTCSNLKVKPAPSWKDLSTDPDLLSLYKTDSEKESVREIVRNILQKLQVPVLPKAILTWWNHLSSWICYKFMASQFESVVIHAGQLLLLQDIHSRKLPVIYVPTFRSKFDKPLILWALAHNGFEPPMFLRDHKSKGEAFWGYYGGIATDLEVNVDISSEKKYSAAVSTYLRHLLGKGKSWMINFETRRSRDGRQSPNVVGSEFLNIIYEEYTKEKIEDAYFVPVSVSYEHLPELEQLVDPEVHIQGSSWLWNVLCAVMNPRKTGTGLVKLNIAQPVSFRELYSSLEKNVKVRRILDENLESYHYTKNCLNMRWASNDSLNSVCSLYGELGPLYPDQFKLETVLGVMAHHLVYDAGKSESIMPTHLLAFLLMKKFPLGVSLTTLKLEMAWLIKIIQINLQKDFGFYLLDCKIETIIFHALKILKSDVIVKGMDGEDILIERSDHHISLLKLEYYANYLLPYFMMDAVIATAIFSLHGLTYTTLRGFDKEVVIPDGDLMLHCRLIYNTLTSSFLLHRPCVSIDTAIRSQINELTNQGHLSLKMADTRRYHFEDDDDDYDYNNGYYANNPVQEEIIDEDFTFLPEAVRVTTRSETFEYFDFCRRLASPYFEIFAFLSDQLKILLTKEGKRMEYELLVSHLHEKLEGERGNLFRHCRELCTKNNVHDFLACCEDKNVLEVESDSNRQRFYILRKTESDLLKQSTNLLKYVTV